MGLYTACETYTTSNLHGPTFQSDAARLGETRLKFQSHFSAGHQMATSNRQGAVVPDPTHYHRFPKGRSPSRCCSSEMQLLGALDSWNFTSQFKLTNCGRQAEEYLQGPWKDDFLRFNIHKSAWSSIKLFTHVARPCKGPNWQLFKSISPEELHPV